MPQLATETDASGGLLREYTYGLGRISMTTPSAVGFYSTDMLGTVTEMSDISGTSLGEFTSDPYGDNQTATGVDPSVAGNPFGYAGAYQDPVTGLYDMHARQYDAATGRFLSQDPAGVPGTSAYTYVGDNPLGFTDPTGMHRVSNPPNTCPVGAGLRANCRDGGETNPPPTDGSGLPPGGEPQPGGGRCSSADCPVSATTGEKCRLAVAAICGALGLGGSGEPPNVPPRTIPDVAGQIADALERGEERAREQENEREQDNGEAPPA